MLSVIYLLAMAGASDQAVPHKRSTGPSAPPPPIVAPVPPPVPYPSGSPAVVPNMAATPKGNPGSWVTNDDYPRSALIAEASGLTAFKLTITKWGSVADCEITLSSGNEALDEATCRNVAVRASFFPATDKDAKPISGSYANRVRWVVPSDSPASTVTYVPPLPSRYAPTIVYPRSPSLISYGWNSTTSADYPTKAEMEERTGTTYFDLTISAVGVVTDCKFTTTSGHADLDQKSCEIAMRRARFQPALDVQGNASVGRVSTGVSWALPNTSSASATAAAAYKAPPQRQLFKESGFTEIEYIMNADGTFGTCTEAGDLFKKMGESNICDLSKTRPVEYQPYSDAAGKPVAKKVKVRMSVDITDPQ